MEVNYSLSRTYVLFGLKRELNVAPSRSPFAYALSLESDETITRLLSHQLAYQPAPRAHI